MDWEILGTHVLVARDVERHAARLSRWDPHRHTNVECASVLEIDQRRGGAGRPVSDAFVLGSIGQCNSNPGCAYRNAAVVFDGHHNQRARRHGGLIEPHRCA
jgi:hypothetical protein